MVATALANQSAVLSRQLLHPPHLLKRSLLATSLHIQDIEQGSTHVSLLTFKSYPGFSLTR